MAFYSITDMTDKLYLIDLGYPLNEYYVIAKDPTAAYKKLRKDLDSRDYGFRKHREMKTITLLAENDYYTECKNRILI